MLAGCASDARHSFIERGVLPMTEEEIRTALVGNSLVGTDSTGAYTIHYSAYGQMAIVYTGFKSGRTRNDSGTWRSETRDDGGWYCRQWTTLGKGKERCVQFFREGDMITWVESDGEITDNTELLAGNPENL
jgi:hypothetical protein